MEIFTDIEHIFYCIIHLTCQVLSFIHAFVLHTNGLKVDVDYIPELIFSPGILADNAPMQVT